MKKKTSFLKEKIIYTSIAVFVVLLSTISFSFAFTKDTKVEGNNSNNTYDIPVVNFKKTGTYHINGNNSYDKIDVILTSSGDKKTTCTFDIYFEFTGDNPFITSDDNLINVLGYDDENEIVNLNLESVNKENYQKIGEYSISAENGKTVTKNLIFYVSSNNIDNSYEGYIDLRNVICDNN